MTRIAIDAMGGDHAPREIVAGAVWAASEYDVAIELVGKQDRIEYELDRINTEGIISTAGGFKDTKIKIDVKKLDIKVTPATEVIEMGEAPGQAIRKKKKSSIVLAFSASLGMRSSHDTPRAAAIFCMFSNFGFLFPCSQNCTV